jgi:hypothetical protein
MDRAQPHRLGEQLSVVRLPPSDLLKMADFKSQALPRSPNKKSHHLIYAIIQNRARFKFIPGLD